MRPGNIFLFLFHTRCVVLDELLQPPENALPSFSMVFRGLQISGESILRNADQRSRPGFLRTAWMQSIHSLGCEFPADDGLRRVVTTHPRVHEQSRRIDLEIFAFDVESLAIRADAVAAPLAARTHVHGRLRNMVETILSPPLRKLAGIADRLKHTRRRRSNEDLGDNSILIRRDSCSGHFLRSSNQCSGISGE